MIEYAILHYPESKYCYAKNTRELALRIRIAKEDFPKIFVIYGGKYEFALKQLEHEMERTYEDRLYAYYTVSLKLNDPRVVYIFKIVEDNKIYYFSEDGLSKEYDFSLSFYNCFQYSYLNACDILETVEWMKEAVFYQIFVDRFLMGNEKKDKSYINLEWGSKPNPKSFAGGDLEGIITKLDYIKSLGVNVIYLTPIFKSISNHKYDISNYYEVDEMFGNKKVLKELVKECHKRKIRLILDAVFNHTSENLQEFQDVKLKKHESKYYDWFIVNSDEPFTYECFASCQYMPKFNTSNEDVENYLINIGCYWIKEFDIDGWRLDVSDEVSHRFWRKFREAIKNTKRDAVLIGENWHDANVYLQGDQYDSIMNYAFTKSALDFYAFQKLDAKELANKLNSLLVRNSDQVNTMMLNLLDSHDTLRFYTEVKKNDNKLMSALALLFMYPGVPCIYYGTENKMEGGYDPDSRRTMDWSLENKNLDIKDLIRSLASLKKEIRDSEARIYALDDLLYIERYHDYKKWILVINNTKEKKIVAINKLIASNNYEGNILKPNGFVITKIK